MSNSLIVGGKAALDKQSLQALSGQGCNNFEVHLLHNTLDNISAKEIKSRLNEYNLNPYAIHTPIRNTKDIFLGFGFGSLNKEICYENMRLVKQAIEFTDNVCSINNPIVVVHIDTAVAFEKVLFHEDLMKLRKRMTKLIDYEIAEVLDFIEKRNSKIILCIEHTTSFRKHGDSIFCSLVDTCKEVASIVDNVDKDHVKLTLDISHLLMDVYMKRAINKQDKFDIFEFIENVHQNIGLVHLTFLKNIGQDNGGHDRDHGVPFFKSNLKEDFLNSILKKLTSPACSFPITLEVFEDDYSTYENYKKDFIVVKSLLENLGFSVIK